MDEHTSHELAYKKGYDKGYEDGKRDAVKHGHWIKNNHIVTCSVCGCIAIPHDGKDYCPYCGAMMDEKEEQHGTK